MGFYFRALLEDRVSPPWPPPAPPTPQPFPEQAQTQQPAGSNLDSRISPSILLIIAILAVIFFLSGLLHLLIRFLFRPAAREAEDADNATALQGQLQQLFHLHDAGVDQSFIDTLPVFLYRAVMGAKEEDRRRPFDCAVCLCEFEPDDRLRLLPKCSHAFHVDCIDTWLLSHSTCPLCRRSLFPDFSPTSSPTRQCGAPLVLVLESGGGSSGNTSGREIVPEGGVSMRMVCQNDNSFVDFSGAEEQQRPCTAAVVGPTLSMDGRKLCDVGGIKEDTQPPLAVAVSGAEGTCKVVSVKLGKFRNLGPGEGGRGGCEGEGSSSGVVTASSNPNKLNDRRCFSMGSFEYVMDERSNLQVEVEYPPPKKQASGAGAEANAARKRRMAMSECDCHSQREGFRGFLDTLPPPANYRHNYPSSSSSAAQPVKKESFSVSKIWLRGRRDRTSSSAAEDGSRRSFSFRRGATWGNNSNRDLPSKGGKSGGGTTASMAPASEFDSGSEFGADVEGGSCDGTGNGGRELSRGDEMPSFARRTLLWVLGRNQKVGSHT